jgi:hypothetical protein
VTLQVGECIADNAVKPEKSRTTLLMRLPVFGLRNIDEC